MSTLDLTNQKLGEYEGSLKQLHQLEIDEDMAEMNETYVGPATNKADKYDTRMDNKKTKNRGKIDQKTANHIGNDKSNLDDRIASMREDAQEEIETQDIETRASGVKYREAKAAVFSLLLLAAGTKVADTAYQMTHNYDIQNGDGAFSVLVELGVSPSEKNIDSLMKSIKNQTGYEVVPRGYNVSKRLIGYSVDKL